MGWIKVTAECESDTASINTETQDKLEYVIDKVEVQKINAFFDDLITPINNVIEIEYGAKYSFEVTQLLNTNQKQIIISKKDNYVFEWYFTYNHYEKGVLSSSKFKGHLYELELENIYMSDDQIHMYIKEENSTQYYMMPIKVKFKFEFNRTSLVQDVISRKSTPSLISQPGPLCGIAAPCYIWAKHKKDEYAESVLELHAKGWVKVNDYKISPDNHLFSLKTSKIPSGKSSADWVLLASIRDSESWFIDYGDSDNEGVAGITTSGTVEKILKKMCNFSIVEDETLLGLLNKVPVIRWTQNGVKERIEKIDKYYNDNKEILLMIDSDLIDDDYSIDPDYHWVVYTGNLVQTDDKAKFSVYSWGRLNRYIVNDSYARIRRNWYQYIVVKV